MVILGLDPGTATTGYGVIRVLGNRFQMLEYGIISTPAKNPMEKRLEMIYDNLQELLQKWQPDQAAGGRIVFQSKYYDGDHRRAGARGAVIMLRAE